MRTEAFAGAVSGSSKRHRPPIWPVVLAFVAALVLVFVTTTALVFAVAAWRAHGRTAQVTDEATRFAVSAAGVCAGALVSASVFAAVSFVTARLQGDDVRTALRLGSTRASVSGVVAAIVGMSGLSIASGSVCDLLGLRGHSAMDAIARALERPTPLRFAIQIASIAIAPGMAEEAFFRGLIQTRLAARWGRWPSIVATALAFGLIHLDAVQSVVAFVAGLFLGWLTERFGGTRPSMSAHTVHNAMFVVLASLGSAETNTRRESLLGLVVGSVACIGAIVLLHSRLAMTARPRPRRDEVNP
jgi:membrane protease YdiL (CAAX protease family)